MHLSHARIAILGLAALIWGWISTGAEAGYQVKNLVSDIAGLAPKDFGQFGGVLLMGDKESGQINAFDPNSGVFLGLVATVTNNPASTNDGLWSLSFGTGAAGSGPNTLYAFAGINNEADGLVVGITPVPEPNSAALAGIGGAIARHRRASNRA